MISFQIIDGFFEKGTQKRPSGYNGAKEVILWDLRKIGLSLKMQGDSPYASDGF